MKMQRISRSVAAFFLALVLLIGLVPNFNISAYALGELSEVYINQISGSDENDGTTQFTAVKTWDIAKSLLGIDGTIYVVIADTALDLTGTNVIDFSDYGNVTIKVVGTITATSLIGTASRQTFTFKNVTFDFGEISATSLQAVISCRIETAVIIGEGVTLVCPDGVPVAGPVSSRDSSLTIDATANITGTVPKTGDYANLTVTDNRPADGTEPGGTTPDGISAGNDTAGAVDYAWGYGGTITESSGTFTITAFDDTAKHYVIDTVVVDGAAQTVTPGAKTLTIDDASSSVFVTFAYTASFSNPTYGTLSVSRGGNPLTSGDIVRGGDVLTITVTPNSGYALDTLNLVGLTRDGATDNYIVTAENGDDTPTVSATIVATVKTATPTFSPSGGAVASGSTVTISAEDGATVYYTTNNQNPTTSSTPYTTPIAITSATTLKAIAVKSGEQTSDVATAAYTVITAQTPTITQQGADSAYVSESYPSSPSLRYTVGETATPLTVAAEVSDGGTLSYQWVSGISFNNTIQGATTDAFTPHTTTAGTYYYRCNITNTLGGSTAIINSLRVEVIVAADPNTQYNVTTSGTNYTYIITNNTTSETLTAQTPRTHSQFAKAGDSITVTATPDDGYGISSISAAGVTGSNGSVTFTMPASNATVSVITTSAKTVSTSVVGNGTLAAPTEPGFSGGTVNFTATPAQGYRVSKVEMSTNNSTWITVFGDSINVPTTGVTTVYLRATFVEGGDLTINNAAELATFAANVNSGDSYRGATVTLASDITLTGQWTPIGTAESPFAGTFDGGNKTISGLSITKVHGNEDYYFGLFGYVYGGTLKNVTVDGAITTSTNLIYNVEGAENPTGNGAFYGRVGGIAGAVRDAEIEGCVSMVDITVDYAQIGGIVGNALISTVKNCVNYGNLTNIKRNYYTGGVVGNAERTDISASGNYGNLTLSTEQTVEVDSLAETRTWRDVVYGYAGGITGIFWNGSKIDKCFNKGDITGFSQHTGGITGAINGTSVAISNNYNTGMINMTGKQDIRTNAIAYVGGLVGRFMVSANSAALTNCYNAGQVTNNAQSKNSSTDELYDKTQGTVTATNNYAYGINPTAAQLGDAYKADTGLNGGLPLLDWEDDAVSDTKYAVTFNTTPANATVAVYSDSGRTAAISDAGSLKAGTYFYKVEAANYLTKEGSFTVTNRAVTQTIALDKLAVVKITVLPANIGATVTINGETPISSAGGVFTYNLAEGTQYTANIAANGYNGAVREFIANSNAPITVTLTQSEHSSNADTDNTIFGNGNVGKESIITKDGTYYIGDGATGILTVTAQNVTLVGLGTTKSYDNLYIKCTNPSTSLTLKDVFISVYDANAATKGNLIDFPAGNHTLTMSGTSVLDMDSNASGFATIHVPTGTSLNINGSGYLYIYKSEQGAAIGGNGGATGSDGQPAEANGTITISDGNLFIKGSKQGALIGAGSGASSVGDININGGSIYLIAVARGAAIGGAAGSNGGTPGGTVRVSGGTISISVDYSGAAIGGGGYDGGNDKPGGTLIYTGGSIRTFVNENARSQWNDTARGVNDKPITATKVDGSGNALYLFALDTSKYSSSSIVADGKSISHGGLHTYRYVNEDSQKTSQMQVQYTMNNWEYDNDQHLYLYLQGKNQTLTVGSGSTTTTINLKWNAQTEKFTVEGTDTDDTPANTPSGGMGGEGSISNDAPAPEIIVNDAIIVTPNNENGTSTGKVPSAEITEALDSAKESVAKAKEDGRTNVVAEIKIIAKTETSADKPETTIVELPAGALKEVAAANDIIVTIESDLATITLDNAALKTIAGTASGNETIQIKVEELDSDGIANSNLDKDAIALVGDAPVFELTILVGNVEVKNFGGVVTVTIPYTPPAGHNSADDELLTVYYINPATGELEEVRGAKYDSRTKTITFKTNHFSQYVIQEWINPFNDAKKSDWFYKSMRFAYSNGLMNGTGTDKFAPQSNLTRAMLVTMLYRLEGEPTITGATEFSDVPSGQWYTNAIAWASKNGIVNGVGDDKFNPNGNITREQLAVMLYRYSEFKKLGTATEVSLGSYTDAEEISSWASDALKWANSRSFITGRTATTLAPKGTATRAEVATIMQRFMTHYA